MEALVSSSKKCILDDYPDEREKIMQYSFAVRDDILVLEIKLKRATVEISGQLKKDLLEKIEDGHHRVVVDLSKTDFVDSSFLGVLVAGLKKATIHNGDMKISGLQSSVNSIFELTRLYRIFDIFEKTEEAVASFQK
jgi:anti-sigma B factor antagonist